MMRVLLFFFFLLSTSCTRSDGFHDSSRFVDDVGNVSLCVTSPYIDTLRIDASSSSLKGEWSINGENLYYIDYTLIGVWKYSGDGRFIEKNIQKGRGPDETAFSFVSATWLDDGSICIIDGNWFFNVFDRQYKRTGEKYPMLSDLSYSNKNWNSLLLHPNPEDDHMYEFNLDSRAMASLGSKVLIPVVTEHVTFNAYSKVNHSKKFWAESYNFMIVDPVNHKTVKKFGHFPEIYQKKRIPAFYQYSFDADRQDIYVSYAADPSIYVFDHNGNKKSSFGVPVKGISDSYPETHSFEEYSRVFREHRAKYGYYQSLKVEGDLVFRSYKLPGNSGYGIQVYQGRKIINDMRFNEEVRVIGRIGSLFYAVTPADVDNDQYVIYRFAV